MPADLPPKFDPPPRFATADAMPKFATADPPVLDYTACLAAVAKGETVYLCVGIPHHPGEYSAAWLFDAAGKAVATGRWKCWKDEKGGLKMEPVAEVKAAAPAPALATDDDHRCDKCGRVQNVHAQTMPDGSHSHKCDGCGHTWWHGGPLGYRKAAPQTPVVQPFRFNLTPPSFAPGGG